MRVRTGHDLPSRILPAPQRCLSTRSPHWKAWNAMTRVSTQCWSNSAGYLLSSKPLQYPPATSGATPQSSPASREPCLPPPPQRYVGEPGSCLAFLSQCSLIFELEPSSFPSDRSRIAYLMTLMSGRALAWATAVWEQQSTICFSLDEFEAEVGKVFDSSSSGREAAQKLLQLCQDPRSVADYAECLQPGVSV